MFIPSFLFHTRSFVSRHPLWSFFLYVRRHQFSEDKIFFCAEFNARNKIVPERKDFPISVYGNRENLLYFLHIKMRRKGRSRIEAFYAPHAWIEPRLYIHTTYMETNWKHLRFYLSFDASFLVASETEKGSALNIGNGMLTYKCLNVWRDTFRMIDRGLRRGLTTGPSTLGSTIKRHSAKIKDGVHYQGRMSTLLCGTVELHATAVLHTNYLVRIIRAFHTKKWPLINNYCFNFYSAIFLDS